MSTCLDCGATVRIVRSPFSKYFAILAVDVDGGEQHVCKII